MTVFWILTGLLTALAGLLVLGGARRGVGGESTGMADLARRELDELDRLKTRGLLNPEAWAAARAEAGRRWLTGRPDVVSASPRSSDPRAVLVGLVVAGTCALGLYVLTGAPGQADQPFQRRVDQWAANLESLEPPQLAAVVARVVRDHPDDHQALVMLGTARFEAGDPIGAASAFRRALEIRPEDAQSWARLGESLVRAQEGVVGGDAEAAFREALKRDPGQLGARYFLGEAALARGDREAVRTLWEPLIAALDPADPRRIDLEARLPLAGAGAAR
ncbi:c-type cytochrome biogenesis protein CcmI [uncultured Brevundimonas sp.]|uniref:c-type cytochrome biogenesis protein CcmI n=1 Tax=uncultured Brevundimonas sp. TaxID=213418 RepID=UPI0030EBB6BE|tara:strand:- start:50096 stop:50926 length:831 start_codon:yes stop_codon:yes gene_type:complete